MVTGSNPARSLGNLYSAYQNPIKIPSCFQAHMNLCFHLPPLGRQVDDDDDDDDDERRWHDHDHDHDDDDDNVIWGWCRRWKQRNNLEMMLRTDCTWHHSRMTPCPKAPQGHLNVAIGCPVPRLNHRRGRWKTARESLESDDPWSWDWWTLEVSQCFKRFHDETSKKFMETS